MDEFRIALISIGVFAIVGILAHGMWTIRKNNKLKEQNESPDALSKKSQQTKVTISSDDPLLSDAQSTSNDSNDVLGGGVGLNQSSKPYLKATSSNIDSDDSLGSADIDPLVGDAPLYRESDLAIDPIHESRQNAEVETQTLDDDSVSDLGDDKLGYDNSGYDNDGIGAVRVVAEANPVTSPQSSPEKDALSHAEPSSEDDELPDPPNSLLRKDEPVKQKVSVDDIPMIDTSIDIDESPRRSGALKKEHTRTEVVGGNRMGKKSESIAERAMKFVGRGQDSKDNDIQARESNVAKTKPKKTASKNTDLKKSNPKKDQIHLDLEAAPETEPTMQGVGDPRAGSGSQSESDSYQDNVPQQEVLILNVRVPEGKVIQGAVLLPSLLTLGFKFGEHNMFHRHAASNGKGPRLFTLANMFNPGTFDIDNMENFNSTGVSLFMSLPIEADAHQVFNMMHNAARKLADEFGAQVLDGRRSVLTRQSLQQYVEKIREFERRRMIRRS